MGNGIFSEKERRTIIDFAYERQWDKKIAKKTGNKTESLLMHHLKTLSILEALFALIKDDVNLTENDFKILFLTSFIHDAGKETEQWQKKILEGTKDYVPHVSEDLSKEIIMELLNRLKWGVLRERVDEIISIVMQHMEGGRKNAGESLKSITRTLDKKKPLKYVTLTIFLSLADRLASIDAPQKAKKILEGTGFSRFKDLLEIDYHQVNQIRGITTTILHYTMEEVMKKTQWMPLIYFPNGTVYLRKKSPSNKPFQYEYFIQTLKKSLDVFLKEFEDNEAEVVVGIPNESIISVPRLFNWQHLDQYFEVAKKRCGIKSPKDVKVKNVEKYLLIRKIREKYGFQLAKEFLTNKNKFLKNYGEIKLLESEKKEFEKVKAEMAVISPESTLFQFFKGIFCHDIISTPKMTQLAKKKFNAIFGEGEAEKLFSLSTLHPVRDRLMVIDNYWSLRVSQLNNGNNDKIIQTLPNEERIDLLKNTLLKIAKEVYFESSITQTNHYYEVIEEIAKTDFIYPNFLNLKELKKYCNNYLKSWIESKQSQKSKRSNLFICPRCNQEYKERNYVAKEISGFKKKFSNRVIGGTAMRDGMSICVQCELELALRSLASNGKAKDLVVLYPPISSDRNYGERARKKINELERGIEKTANLENINSFQVFGFRNIDVAAKTILENPSFLLEFSRKQSVNEFLKLFSYQIQADSVLENIKKAFEKVINEFGLELSPVPHFKTIEEAIKLIKKQIIIHNEVQGTKEGIDEGFIRKRLVKYYPFSKKNIQFINQTPNFFIWSTSQELGRTESGVDKEAEVNIYLKKIFIGVLIAFYTNYSVAILNPTEIIPLSNKGKLLLPPNTHIRRLFGNKDWLQENEIQNVCLRLAAAIILSKRAEYPVRTNVYSVLAEEVKGKILRRIEVKKKYIENSDIKYLEILQGVIS
ncbi:MAG: type I-D CRISPR-associated protein Cas10d/Csc3 [Promethearchaeota archaeon]